MASFDSIFKKVDEVFAEVDKFFANWDGSLDDVPKSQAKPAETHTHHVDFRATTKRERAKLFCRFICMAFAVLFRGKTKISFKNRSKT